MTEPVADFLDTNVFVYLTAGDAKAGRAEALVADKGIISAQVLNETVAVLRHKNKLGWAEIEEVLAAMRANCEVVAVTDETSALAVAFARRFNLHIYDASIVAAAKLAGCKTLWSEDMQDGQVIDGVRIRNPF